MLARSRTSALINVVVFILCWAGAYFPIFLRISGAELFPPQSGLGTVATILMSALLLLIMAVFVSRMFLVTGLGERGFGLIGLARWAVMGVLTGTATALLYTALTNWLGDSGARSLLEPLLNVALLILVYWLVFQRNPLRLATGRYDDIPDRRMARVVIGLSTLVIIAGFYFLATVKPPPLWPVAHVNFGLGALNIAAADLVHGKASRQKSLLATGAGLFLIGIGLLVALTALAA